MSNWAEGTFKVRGTYDNIVNYLDELLVTPTLLTDNKPKQAIICEKDDFEIRYKSPADYFYLKGTRRAFIDKDEILIWIDKPRHEDEEDDIKTIEIQDFQQAWAAIPKNYIELSKKHSVDIKIFTFELGMEFTQEIEIVKGVITKNEEKKYSDYRWDVPFSRLGG